MKTIPVQIRGQVYKANQSLLDTSQKHQGLLGGVTLACQRGQAEPSRRLTTQESSSVIQAPSDEDRLVSIKKMRDTDERLFSSALIGLENSKTAEVDLSGKVHRVLGLRGVDDFIFPHAVSAASNLTVILMTKKITDYLPKYFIPP